MSNNFIKQVLGIHSPSKVTRTMFDIREIGKAYINDGCRDHYQMVSDCLLDILMTDLRGYFQVFELDFNGNYALYNTIVDNKLNYMVHIHNNFDVEDSYLIKLSIHRYDNMNVDKIDDGISKALKELLSKYQGNYKQFKFDMELLFNNKVSSKNDYIELIIEKIDIPDKVFNTIYGGLQ